MIHTNEVVPHITFHLELLTPISIYGHQVNYHCIIPSKECQFDKVKMIEIIDRKWSIRLGPFNTVYRTGTEFRFLNIYLSLVLSFCWPTILIAFHFCWAEANTLSSFTTAGDSRHTGANKKLWTGIRHQSK